MGSNPTSVTIIKLKKMEIKISTISYSTFKDFPKINYFWMFRKYKHVRGFKFRFFGYNFNITENYATKKLIDKIKNHGSKKTSMG